MYGQHEFVYSHEAYACSLVIMYWIDFCFWPILLWIYCIICFHEFAVCLYKKYFKKSLITDMWLSVVLTCFSSNNLWNISLIFINFSVITGWRERMNKYCKKIMRYFLHTVFNLDWSLESIISWKRGLSEMKISKLTLYSVHSQILF